MRIVRGAIFLVVVGAGCVDPSPSGSGPTGPGKDQPCEGDCQVEGAVMLGGRSGLTDTVPLTDIWSWSGTAWTQLSIEFPPGRPQCLGVASGQIFAYSDVASTGSGGVVPNMLGYLGWTGSTWTPLSAPSTAEDFTSGTGPTTVACSTATAPPLGPDAVMAPFHDQIVLVGGSPTQTWIWDHAWHQLDVPGPTPRGYASIAALGDQLVLFGGEVSDGNLLNDTWAWDGTAWTQLEPAGPVPPPRMSGAIAAVGGALVLFGGWDPTDDTLSDTWTWDGHAWTAHDVSGPTDRAEALMVTQAAATDPIE